MVAQEAYWRTLIGGELRQFDDMPHAGPLGTRDEAHLLRLGPVGGIGQQKCLFDAAQRTFQRHGIVKVSRHDLDAGAARRSNPPRRSGVPWPERGRREPTAA